MSIYQDNRLLKIQISGFNLPCYVTAFNAAQKFSSPFLFKVKMTAQGNSCRENLIDKKACIEIVLDNEFQVFHGYITQAVQRLGELDEQHYELEIAPFLHYLDQKPKQRIFEGLSVLKIINQLCKEHGYYGVIEPKLVYQYSPIPYVVQYDETDLAFIQRLLSLIPH